MKKKRGLIFIVALTFMLGIFVNAYASENKEQDNVSKKVIKINDTELKVKNVIYVDNNGSDENGDGSEEKPFKNVDTAIKNAKSEDAIFIKAGKYKLRPIYVSEYISAGIHDMWKNLTFIGEGKDTILEYYGKESKSRGGQLFYLGNKSSKVIGMSFNFYPGKAPDYDSAIFVGSEGSFHNMYVQTLGKNGSTFSYYNAEPQDTPKIYNSIFNFDVKPNSDYSGKPKYINCISNYFTGGNRVNSVAKAVDFEKIEELKTDDEIISKGVGVYSGEFAWGKIQIEDNIEVKAESITLDKTSMDLLEGKSDKITATVSPENTTNKKVIWTSSDESIAKVDAEGNVTAIKEGQVTIIAQIEGTNAISSCNVTVESKDKEEGKTTWNPEENSYYSTLSNDNMTARINTIAGVRGTNFKTSGKWYWEITIDESDVAAVGVANDNATNLTRTALDYDNMIAYYGGNGNIFKENISYGEGFKAGDIIGIALDIDGQKINFYKNNISQGEKDIPNLKKYYPFYINGSSHAASTVTANFGLQPFKYAPPIGFLPFDRDSYNLFINLSTNNLDLLEGKSDKITATVSPENDTNKKVIWTSSDESIAKVDENGNVEGIKEGKAIITAQVEGTNVSASCNVTVKLMDKSEHITVESESNKLRVGQEFTTDIVLHNGVNICAEDIKIDYDTKLFEYVGYDEIDGLKVVKEINNNGSGSLRFITASLGKDNAINGDKSVLKLKFKAKEVGKGKVDVIKTRIANNGTIEKDILEENCGEKEFTIVGDVNRDGEFTLLDLGIDAWYYGDNVEDTDTSKYDTDVTLDGKIDEGDLLEIGDQIIKNPNYKPNN